ncbi:MAG: hypothetical protein PHX86_08670 [Caldisericia bacterium]|nr:hypothetical protein [Caldisericia bacterium]
MTNKFEISDKELHRLLAKNLSQIWVRVTWKQMTSMNRKSYDVFAERIRAAAGKKTVSRMIEKVCTGLRLPAAELDTDDIYILEDERGRVQKMFSEDAILLALLTKKEAEKTYEQKKIAKGNSSLEAF